MKYNVSDAAVKWKNVNQRHIHKHNSKLFMTGEFDPFLFYILASIPQC